MDKEERGDDFELSLELSIGGRYSRKQAGDSSDKNANGDCNNQTSIWGVSRSEFCCNGGGFVGEFSDPQRRKEIQALRRQEARKKREERIKKSTRFADDRVFLEAQKFEIRVRDREIRETEDDLGRKNLVDGLYHKVQHPFAYCDWDHPNGIDGCRKPTSLSSANGSLDRSSSDYQSTSQKGGSSSDTGSQSSRQLNHILPMTPLDHQQINESSSQVEPIHHHLRAAPEHKAKIITPIIGQPSCGKFAGKSSTLQTSNSHLTPDKPAPAPANEISGPHIPKPPNPTHNATSPVPHMPCVSTTGNGPNGKTITGFLYKYTNNEVSIMCVCHGSSFSPAEFVEHAGGINISNPLRHITVVPSSLGCS